jgi:hypothetical protein
MGGATLELRKARSIGWSGGVHCGLGKGKALFLWLDLNMTRRGGTGVSHRCWVIQYDVHCIFKSPVSLPRVCVTEREIAYVSGCSSTPCAMLTLSLNDAVKPGRRAVAGGPLNVRMRGGFRDPRRHGHQNLKL